MNAVEPLQIAAPRLQLRLLRLHRAGGAIDDRHQLAELASRIGRADARAQFARSYAPEHTRDALHVAADAGLRNVPGACECQ